MAATAAQIEELRRMVDEPTSATYSDALLTTILERYQLLDERGELPYTWDTSTSPPTKDVNEDWIATYDLNAAAAIVWGEKAGTVAEDFTFGADGGNYSRSQVVEHYQQRERFYMSRRAIGSIKGIMQPPIDSLDEVTYIGNAAEVT
jgi:hypothetical protein